MKKLPHEEVVYLGDTARVPFGGRQPAEIVQINREIIPFLLKHEVKLVVMACGTSSAIAYPIVKDDFPVEIINIIEPGARAAVAATQNGKIGVVATVATVNSNAYPEKIEGINKELAIFSAACPLFVPLIENGHIETEEARRITKEYLAPLLKEKIDTLILGCTHYPHLVRVIWSITGPDVKIIDPAEETALEIKQLLKRVGTLRTTAIPPKYHYYVTGSPIHFQEVGSRLLGKVLPAVKQVVL